MRRRQVLVALMIAFACALLAASRWWGDRAAQEAIAVTQLVGAKVETAWVISYVAKDGNLLFSYAAGSPPRRVAWFVVGEPVSFVDLSYCSVSDDQADSLKAFRRCAVLSLHETKVSSQGISRLLEMPSLQLVDLRGLAIDEEAVARLERLKHLRVLIISSELAEPSALSRLRQAVLSRQWEIYDVNQ